MIPSDAPFTINLYAKSTGNKKYYLVANQSIVKNDIQNLQNGSFLGVLSTISVEDRESFIQKRLSKKGGK